MNEDTIYSKEFPEALNRRIDKSEEDFKNGWYKTSEELLKRLKNKSIWDFSAPQAALEMEERVVPFRPKWRNLNFQLR